MAFPNEIHSLFHFSEKKKGLLFTKPEYAFLYYIDRKVNLLTGDIIHHSQEQVLEELLAYKLNERKKNAEVIHFCYEFGNLLCLNESVPLETVLFIKIKYCHQKWIDYPRNLGEEIDIRKETSISKKSYDKKFNKIMKHLIDGDCYQVNFTHRHRYKISKKRSLNELLTNFYSFKNLSEYAHHTYIPFLEKLILSNSPECLFQIYTRNEELEIHSTPIKGTIKGEGIKEAKKLLSSQKDIAELNMITDLIRNDLAKIEKPRVKVLKKRELLKVPGLWHLYSRISVRTSKQVSLLSLMSALFPGGSITGAPKKRVMKIIQNLEDSPRGHYCGSTFLNFKGLMTASINIRTFEVDLVAQKFSLGAGGGITLMSQSGPEYLEMQDKQESLLKVLHLITWS